MRVAPLLPLLLAVLLAGCAVEPIEPASGAASATTPGTLLWDAPVRTHLQVSAQVDGRSMLHVEGGEIWWEHFDYEAPGRYPGEDHPTLLNGETWYPRWPTEGAQTWCRGCETARLSLATFGEERADPATVAFAQADMGKAALVCHACRVPVGFSYTDRGAVFVVNDNDPAGWDWYVFDIVVG